MGKSLTNKFVYVVLIGILFLVASQSVFAYTATINSDQGDPAYVSVGDNWKLWASGTGSPMCSCWDYDGDGDYSECIGYSDFISWYPFWRNWAEWCFDNLPYTMESAAGWDDNKAWNYKWPMDTDSATSGWQTARVKLWAQSGTTWTSDSISYRIDSQCTSGACCDSSGNYEDSNTICESDVTYEYGCPWGTDPGDNVGKRYKDQYCSGSSSSCNGALEWDDWSTYDYCSNSEQCVPGQSSCQAVVVPCTLASASWSTTSATEGQTVSLTVNGNGDCQGQSVSFEVSEYDIGSSDEGVTVNPSSTTFNSNGVATGSWIAEWQLDGLLGASGDPEYYFTATKGSSTLTTSTNDAYLLHVSQVAPLPGTMHADPRCSNDPSSGGTCTTPEGQTMGIKNTEHDIDPGYLNWVCFDWWNDNNAHAGSVYLDGHNWDWCQGNCPGLGSTCDTNLVANRIVILQETTGTNRPVRVLATGWDTTAGVNVHAQDTIYFTWTSDDPDPDPPPEGPECTSGACCDTSTQTFRGTNHNCAPNYDTVYTCNEGTAPGSDVYSHTRKKYCSGTSSSCTGRIADNPNDRTVDICTLSEQCVEGVSTCQPTGTDPGSGGDFSVQVEAAPSGVRVYKRPGDYVTLIVNSETTQAIDIDIPTNFILIDGEATSTSVSASTGEIELKFLIDEDASTGRYTFEFSNLATESSVDVRVLLRPELIVLTNSEKMHERFSTSYSSSSIDSIIQAGYTKAADNGVVYDLSDYIEESDLPDHPWSNYASYASTPTDPQVGNAYMSALSQFAVKRCENTCGDIIILGDDYVVPFYRADITDLPWYNSIFNNPDTDYIYTDTPYIPNEIVPVKDANALFERAGSAAIVKPDSPSSALNTEITNLQSLIETEYGLDVDVYSSGSIDCDSHVQLGGKLLFLVGDRDNNNAIKCVPWFQETDPAGSTSDASFSIERNVWGGGEYAFILSGDDLTLAVETMQDFVNNPFPYQPFEGNSISIYDFPTPGDELSAYEFIQGYVLGKCEKVGGELQGTCIVSDFGASLAPGLGIVTDARDAVLFCPTALISYAGEPEYLDSIVCAASAGGAVSSVAAFAGVGIPSDIVSGVIKRAAKTARSLFKADMQKFLRIIGFEGTGSAKQIIGNFLGLSGSASDNILKSSFKEWDIFLKRHSRAAQEIVARGGFTEAQLTTELGSNRQVWAQTIEGTEKVMAGFKKGSGKTLADVPLSSTERLGAVKVIGELSDGSVKNVDSAARGLGSANSVDDAVGRVAELKRTSVIKESGGNLDMAIREPRMTTYIDADGITVTKQIELDVSYTENGAKIAEEVKTTDWGYIKTQPYYQERLDTLTRQMKEYSGVVDVDEVRLVSKYPITSEVQAIVDSYPKVSAVIGGGI